MGADLTIVALKPGEVTPSKQNVVIEDVVHENLSTRQGRVRNAARIIRLVKVLRALEHQVKKDVDTDMFTLIR